MKRSLRISDIARADIFEIWSYVAEDNPEAADRVVDGIIQGYERLLERPGIGHKHRDIKIDVRCLTVRDYLIFYRADAETIDIFRVLHGSRDITKLTIE